MQSEQLPHWPGFGSNGFKWVKGRTLGLFSAWVWGLVPPLSGFSFRIAHRTPRREILSELGMVGFEREYWAWCQAAKERYDERVAILSDGGKITSQIHRIAQMEARKVHARTVAERACSRCEVSFEFGQL